MTEATRTVSESGVSPLRLAMAVVMALAGFSLAVMGFVVDNTAMILTGSVAGCSGSTAVNALANAANRWRRSKNLVVRD
jgi:NAD/NADP transhydrogenase beta subunit